LRHLSTPIRLLPAERAPVRTVTRRNRGVLPFILAAFAACGDTPTGELPPPAIVLTAPTRTVSAGSTLQLSAAVTEANGSASTRTVQWESSNPAVATVSGSGLVTGLGGGETTITAAVGGASATLDLTGMRAPNPGGPQSTFLSYTSQPGDYIGGGATAQYGVSSGTWTAATTGAVDGDRVLIRFDGGGGTDWNVNFAAPKGQTLKVGTYEGATRYPFHEGTAPGLSFYGSGVGCNTVTGRFVIHDIAVDHEGKVHRLHASFRQHCEGGAPYLDGEVAVLMQPLR
jgi:hypothetical protein